MRPRRVLHRAPTPAPIGLVIAMHLLLAGCAAGQAGVQKGQSGPIVWEIVDIRRTVEDQGNRMRWDYTLVLRNTGSTTVTFDQMTLITMAPGSTLTGGHIVQPFVRALGPGAEMRDPSQTYTHGCVQTCDPQWVHQMFRAGVTRVIEIRGRDGAGRAVTPIIRLRLDSSVGNQSARASERIRFVAIREPGPVAGQWRGTMLGAISPAAGNVTLYGADGRPRLTFEPDGADRKGELTP